MPAARAAISVTRSSSSVPRPSGQGHLEGGDDLHRRHLVARRVLAGDALGLEHTGAGGRLAREDVLRLIRGEHALRDERVEHEGQREVGLAPGRGSDSGNTLSHGRGQRRLLAATKNTTSAPRNPGAFTTSPGTHTPHPSSQTGPCLHPRWARDRHPGDHHTAGTPHPRPSRDTHWPWAPQVLPVGQSTVPGRGAGSPWRR